MYAKRQKLTPSFKPRSFKVKRSKRIRTCNQSQMLVDSDSKFKKSTFDASTFTSKAFNLDFGGRCGEHAIFFFKGNMREDTSFIIDKNFKEQKHPADSSRREDISLPHYEKELKFPKIMGIQSKVNNLVNSKNRGIIEKEEGLYSIIPNEDLVKDFIRSQNELNGQIFHRPERNSFCIGLRQPPGARSEPKTVEEALSREFDALTSYRSSKRKQVNLHLVLIKNNPLEYYRSLNTKGKALVRRKVRNILKTRDWKENHPRAHSKYSTNIWNLAIRGCVALISIGALSLVCG